MPLIVIIASFFANEVFGGELTNHGSSYENVENFENNHIHHYYNNHDSHLHSYGNYHLNDNSNLENTGQLYHQSNFIVNDNWGQQSTNYNAEQSPTVSQHVTLQTNPRLATSLNNIGVEPRIEHPEYSILPIIEHIPFEVVKHVIKYVEKKVPTPVLVEKHVPIQKDVAYFVEKYIPHLIERPYPIHIPIYHNVYHRNTENSNVHSRRSRKYYR